MEASTVMVTSMEILTSMEEVTFMEILTSMVTLASMVMLDSMVMFILEDKHSSSNIDYYRVNSLIISSIRLIRRIIAYTLIYILIEERSF